jgi:Helix-hairpin-helix domain
MGTVDYTAIAKQNGATSSAPPPGGGIDYAAIAKQNGAVSSTPAAPDTPKPPGFFSRLASSVGIPSSMDEVKSMAAKEEALPWWQKALPHAPGSSPSAADSIAGAVLGPAYPMVKGYLQNTGSGIKEGYQEADEADKQLSSGQITTKQAIGKTAYAAAHAVINAVPFIGPTINTMGEDAATKNWRGFAGGATGVVGQLAAPEVAEKVAPLFKAKPVLARAIPGVEADAARIATPHIQNAATDLGLDLKTATSDDVLSSIRQAKQNLLLKAQSSLPEGATLDALPPDQQALLQQHTDALSHVQDMLTAAQEKAAGNAKAVVPDRGAAAKQVLRGITKSAAGSAIGSTVGSVVPGAGHVVGAMVGATGGLGDIASGMKGMVAKTPFTPELLNTRLRNALTSSAPPAVSPSVAPAEPGAQPFTPYAGDLSVEHTSSVGPPEVPGGDLKTVGAGEQPPVTKPAPYRLTGRQIQGATTVTPKQIIGSERQLAAAPDVPAPAPRGITQGKAPYVPGAAMEPAPFLTMHGAETGETAALMQLAHTGGQALRRIATARGLKIPAAADNVSIIQKIHDDLSPEEIQSFGDAAKARAQERAVSLEGVDPAIVSDNRAIAQKLYSKADEMQAAGESPYKIRAWRTAGESIETRPTPVKDILGDTDALKTIRGVDSRMAQHIQEVTGSGDPTPVPAPQVPPTPAGTPPQAAPATAAPPRGITQQPIPQPEAPQPQLATEANTEELLRQSLAQRGITQPQARAATAGASPPGQSSVSTTPPAGGFSVAQNAEQGGHAGNTVSSVEELNRPGTNYVVSKSGQLTYHGKSFAPESTPSGASHVTALPDGTLRVNAGPQLNAAQELALRNALPKKNPRGITQPIDLNAPPDQRVMPPEVTARAMPEQLPNTPGNSPMEAKSYLEQAAQNLFGKPFAALTDAERAKTYSEGARLQDKARKAKGPTSSLRGITASPSFRGITGENFSNA